jgi:N-acetylglutamate synthase
MNVDIAPMAPADFDEVTALWRRSEGVGLNESDRRGKIEAFLRRNPGLSVVARFEGAVVGAVLCGHDGRRGYLHHLAVDAAWRRNGVGRALVDRCLAELKTAGIDRCNIFLYADNEPGERFWKTTGWYERDLKVLSRDIVPV